jgi:hypothetical protein
MSLLLSTKLGVTPGKLKALNILNHCTEVDVALCIVPVFLHASAAPEMRSAYTAFSRKARSWVRTGAVSLAHTEEEVIPLGNSEGSGTGTGITATDEKCIKTFCSSIRSTGVHIPAYGIWALFSGLQTIGNDKITDILIYLLIDHFSSFTKRVATAEGWVTDIKIVYGGKTVTVLKATGKCLIPLDILARPRKEWWRDSLGIEMKMAVAAITEGNVGNIKILMRAMHKFKRWIKTNYNPGKGLIDSRLQWVFDAEDIWNSNKLKVAKLVNTKDKVELWLREVESGTKTRSTKDFRRVLSGIQHCIAGSKINFREGGQELYGTKVTIYVRGKKSLVAVGWDLNELCLLGITTILVRGVTSSELSTLQKGVSTGVTLLD